MDQLSRITKTASTIIPDVSVFVEKQDSFLNEFFVWISHSKSSPLESMSGMVVNGISHRAIFDSLEGAMKFLPFLDQAAKNSDMKFKLVRFTKERTLASI